jgi:hypothetical protein
VTSGGILIVLCASPAPVLLRSPDVGETWAVDTTPSLHAPPTAVELAPVGDFGWVWAAGSRSAAETADGRTWNAVVAEAIPVGTLVAVDITADAVIALVAASDAVRLVQRSPDTGAWSEIATWPTSP